MKKISKYGIILVLTAIIFAGCAGSNSLTQSSDPGAVTYQVFYDNLSPYGTWIDYPGYGNVWNPRIGTGFRPYATNGHWLYSNEGWLWQSNYSWGWAPFHYGRWLYDDLYGWLWEPGYDWSPAWVTWGYSDGYYAWAPLMPGVNVGSQFGGWRPNYYYWNVCDRDRIYDKDLPTLIERKERDKDITNNLTIINNYNKSRNNNYYARGPEIEEVQKYTGRKIEPVSVREVEQIKKTRRQGKESVNVYRPVIDDSQPVDLQNSASNQRTSAGSQGSPVKDAGKRKNEEYQKSQQVETRKPRVNQETPERVRPVNEKNNINQQTSTPEPRNLRKAEVNQTKPIQSVDQQPSIHRSEQRRNIEQLPVQRSPGNINNNNPPARPTNRNKNG